MTDARYLAISSEDALCLRMGSVVFRSGKRPLLIRYGSFFFLAQAIPSRYQRESTGRRTIEAMCRKYRRNRNLTESTKLAKAHQA